MLPSITRALAALAGVLLLSAQAAQAQEAPANAEDWRTLAIRDLEAARDTLRAQTPIPFDQENPAYPAWLETGFAAALERARQAQDAASAYYAVAFFINGFHDPHISLRAVTELPTPRWPGFIAASRDGGAVIVSRDETDPQAPPVGAQIEACEGKSLAELAQERVYPFTLNPQLALDRRRAVSRLFIDRGVPGAPPPAQCRIAIDGEAREIALQWRPVPQPADPFWAAFQTASVGAQAEWGIAEPAPGVAWIGIPTFASGEETAPHLAELVSQIAARGDAMRSGRAIVIDVRGNGGGNSAWADRIASAIFGERTARRAKRASAGRTAVDWRASVENADYWEEWFTDVGVAEFGANSPEAREIRRVIDGLRRTAAATPPIWRQGPRRPGPSGGLTTRRPRGGSPFPAHVYLLSNGTCGSSCLDFADTVLFVPGVRLIGSATSGDGPYMETRSITLPSGRASLTFPQKVWRGMPRGALEAYEPDDAYNGAWDDASVRAWVMGLIARQ